MPKTKYDIQNMSINDPQQNISVKITFYFNILKQSILDLFENYPSIHIAAGGPDDMEMQKSSGHIYACNPEEIVTKRNLWWY